MLNFLETFKFAAMSAFENITGGTWKPHFFDEV
jgi:hypothetical protein